MTAHEKRNYAVLHFIKDLFTKNIAIKVVALVFAMLLWGYVLTDQKPYRTKVVADVPTSFDGEAELLSQGFCVRGDRAEILGKVSVQVRAQITNLTYISPDTVYASISLKNISEARTYDLPVTASVQSGLGVVQQVTPNQVTVEIDSLVTKTIPVTTSFVGETPEGYWADMEALTTTTRLDVSGPKTDIADIVRAECVVDLTDRTSTIYSTFGVVFFDRDNKEVPSDIVVGTIPTSTVRVPIYPMRYVPIDVESALVGADNLAANHELVSAVATPASVRIVGDLSVLETVESIAVEPIPVNGLNAPTTIETEIVVPENVRVLDTNPVSVLVEVRESQYSQTYEQLPITVEGLARGYEAAVDRETVDLTVEGRISVASRVKRGNISIHVDVTGLEAGVYTLPLDPFVYDEDSTLELTTKLSVETVQVTITGPN